MISRFDGGSPSVWDECKESVDVDMRFVSLLVSQAICRVDSALRKRIWKYHRIYINAVVLEIDRIQDRIYALKTAGRTGHPQF